MLLYGLGVILGSAHMLMYLNVIQIIKMLMAGLVFLLVFYLSFPSVPGQSWLPPMHTASAVSFWCGDSIISLEQQ